MDELAPPSPPAKGTIFKFNTGTHLEPKRTVSIDGLRAPQMYDGVSATKQCSTHVRTIRVYEALKINHQCSCQCGNH